MTENEFKNVCRELGGRLRVRRVKCGLTQEDMIGFGFSVGETSYDPKKLVARSRQSPTPRVP